MGADSARGENTLRFASEILSKVVFR